MKKFETQVQKIKYEVLKEVARNKFMNNKSINTIKVSEEIITGPKPSFRCCIYKERHIIQSRINLITKKKNKDEQIIHIVKEACDECPMNRFTVTNTCRGCIAKYCMESCPVNAIFEVNGKAYINQDKCIECGKCKQACPYDAISDVSRPCKSACPVDAISIDENKIAVIDYDKCIECGACLYKCPFGAITDISYIGEVAELITSKNEVYAVVAPAISTQFAPLRITQVVTALKELGFTDVIEVALGADMVIRSEATEFIEKTKEKNFMTTSCCPSFYEMISKKYPKLTENRSTTISPMVAIGKLIKYIHPNSHVVFIGPCVAKKKEAQRDYVVDAIDYVLTFEELQALIGAKEINIEECHDTPLDNASYFGRLFAKSSGVTQSIIEYVKDLDIDFNPVVANGSKECATQLKIASLGRLNGNFIEGMACVGGCISGPASITHQKKDIKEVDKYASLSMEKTTNQALEVFSDIEINMHE